MNPDDEVCEPGSGCFVCRGLNGHEDASRTRPGTPTALDRLVIHPSQLEGRE